jgi:hypothetical protein
MQGELEINIEHWRTGNDPIATLPWRKNRKQRMMNDRTMIISKSKETSLPLLSSHERDLHDLPVTWSGIADAI